MKSKLELRGGRVVVNAADAVLLISAMFCKTGCTRGTARQVAEHLADASLCGVESHGLMRTLQYAEQFESGYLDPAAIPIVRANARGALEVDGRGGIGIPAMQLAYDSAVERARENGICALGVRDAGHTGRHGAFADTAAAEGFLSICIGGGNRHKWPQAAPHGGIKGMLPTNPWCVGTPGGDRGPVVLDFATSQVAGGWIYAARSAGALLPEGSVIDRDGNPTRDPEDYFKGGAILPSGGHKGYALALVAELIGEAMLGPAVTECNWLLIVLDATQFRSAGPLQSAAEEVLSELRNCPPAPGFEQVEIPGERECIHREKSAGTIAVPEATWEQIRALAERLGAD
ncbi:MAG: Ldh family oxidoreductase [Alphaproteobacteria bacterium]|nr:Ldh family oxidoreductase [Alphaproteobacteria bacterium]